MSSMRNANPRRPHRERAQPTARSRWGLLEKHKDYSLRAADYNLKQKKLGQLKEKVRDKHPDEFAYGMVSKQQGKHGKGDESNLLGHDAVQLLKTQDGGYLRVALARGRREIGKVEEEVGMDVKARQGKKVVFAEEQGEADLNGQRGKKRNSNGEVLADVDVNEVSTLDPEDINPDVEPTLADESATTHKPKSKSKKAQAAEQTAAAKLKADRKKRRRLQDMRTAKLELLKKRQKEIMAAADQLDLQRAKMARTVGGVNKNGIRFKIRERKR